MNHLQIVAMLKRKQGKMSLRAFARELGCSASYLSDVYLGRRLPGPALLTKFGIKKTVQLNYVREKGL